MSEAEIDINATQYNRPQHEWTCGKADQGVPCPLGPSALGVCGVEKECRPSLRGGRWKCSRSDAAGGPCDDGPSSSGECHTIAEKCAPTRAIRATRGSLALGSATLMAGLLCVGLSGPWKNSVVAPGPLSKAHGQILNGAERCAACHPAANASFGNWITATFSKENVFASTQTNSCLACHEKTMIAETANLAHSANADRLAEVTTQHLASAKQMDRRPIPAHLSENIACSRCHKEHHGDANLSALTSKQCQACHQNQFHSFNEGHPTFDDWPYEQDRGISFDHASHLGKYFRQAKKDISCSECHVQEEGQIVAVASYEKTCATCHDDFLNQVDSLAVVSLPMIDPEVLKKAELTVGDWPAEAVGDFDGKLPIFSRILLLSDQRASEAMRRLGYDFDFFDLAIDDTKQLQDAAQVAWSLKQLVYELSVDGQATIQGRFETILGRALTTLELQAIAGQMSPAVFRTAQQRWFPNLEQEVTQRRTEAVLVDPSSEGLGGKESVAFGGWFVDPGLCMIGYRPIGHNDELMRSWIELMGELKTKISLEHDWDAEFNKLNLTKQCASCHIHSDSRQWKATSATAMKRGFTHFDHGPHLVLPQMADCKSCHGLSWEHGVSQEQGAAVSESGAVPELTVPELTVPELTVPELTVPEFTAMDKASCAQCHTAQGAGNDCTTCHNYHVDFGPLEAQVVEPVIPPDA